MLLPGLGRAGAAASDGLYEQSVIAALCEPGGTRAVPPEDKLSSFSLTAATLSPSIVGSSLLEHLNRLYHATDILVPPVTVLESRYSLNRLSSC